MFVAFLTAFLQKVMLWASSSVSFMCPATAAAWFPQDALPALLMSFFGSAWCLIRLPRGFALRIAIMFSVDGRFQCLRISCCEGIESQWAFQFGAPIPQNSATTFDCRTSGERRAGSDERGATSGEQLAGSDERDATSDWRGATSWDRQAGTDEREATSGKRRAGSDERGATSGERRAGSN